MGDALQSACAKLGLDVVIAVVLGDYLLPRIDELRKADIREASSGVTLPPKLLTANAYLGARSRRRYRHQRTLRGQRARTRHPYARIRMATGRSPTFWNAARRRRGTCTDWERVPDWANIGSLIAECLPDCSFEVTKNAGTGSLVIPA